ncbi:hypothetical protein OSH10_15245 [Kaistia defluvii]|uniref:hypothetical protein n=1 Tax=Kaistia defluvii TaxID=410841 RepID=UPI00224F7764|nr:hypothetical protein [Kaistia defluvii]MCX5519796.1 hypothetical protein [Kaistia defluvii]
MTFMTYSSPGSHLNGLVVSANDWLEARQVEAVAAKASVFRNLRKFPPLAEAIHKDYGERQGARFLDWTAGTSSRSRRRDHSSKPNVVNILHEMKYISDLARRRAMKAAMRTGGTGIDLN